MNLQGLIDFKELIFNIDVERNISMYLQDMSDLMMRMIMQNLKPDYKNDWLAVTLICQASHP